MPAEEAFCAQRLAVVLRRVEHHFHDAFDMAVRGYRMDEVDDVLDRLVDELDRRGERISELEARLTEED